jgi:serine protease inhibitor
MDRIHRNKTGTNDMSNNRLNKRDQMTSEINMLDEMRLSNRMMERGNMFNFDTRIEDETKKKKNRIGEITGDKFEMSDIDKGMPFRAQYHKSKVIDSDDEREYNKYLDFGIYDSEKLVETDIKYHDPNDNLHNNDFSELYDNNKLLQTEPDKIYSNTVNNYSIGIFNLMRNYMNEGFFISGMELLNSFVPLYVVSSNRTTDIIKKYFNLTDKDTIALGNSELNTHMSKIPKSILKYENIMLISNQKRINRECYDFIKDIIRIIPVDSENYTEESNKINKYIMTQFSDVLPVSDKLFKNLHNGLIVLNVATIKTVWMDQFQKVVEAKVNGRVHKMLYSESKTCMYVEDNINQVIEIPFYDNMLSYGIIMPKNKSHPMINQKQFEMYISNLKSYTLDEVMIPIFKQQMKLKLTNILKSTGFQECFEDFMVPELVKSVNLQDVVQNITLDVNNYVIKSDNKKNGLAKGTRSNSKFIVNSSFIYYVRVTGINTILLVGIYK